MFQYLENKWNETWKSLGLKIPTPNYIEEIRRHYGDRTREYHNFTHLRECFDWLWAYEWKTRLFGERGAIELAIWFHDIIYYPQNSDSEERSCEWATEATKSAGGNDRLIKKVQEMIMLTKGHQYSGNDFIIPVFLDIDLAILGAPPHRFAEYEESIRREFSHVPDSIFATKRREVMESFLSRRSIFTTAFFIGSLENRARRNLSKYLSRDKFDEFCKEVCHPCKNGIKVEFDKRDGSYQHYVTGRTSWADPEPYGAYSTCEMSRERTEWAKLNG